jgi:hypothetical protein
MPAPAATMPDNSFCCRIIVNANAGCPVSRLFRTKMFHVKHFGTKDHPRKVIFGRRRRDTKQEFGPGAMLE